MANDKKKNWLEQTSDRKFEANSEDIELQKLGDMERTGTLDAGTLRSMGLYMSRSETQSTDGFEDIDGRTKHLLTLVFLLQAVTFLFLTFSAMTESWSEFKVSIFENSAQTELKGSLGIWEYCYEIDELTCAGVIAGNNTISPCGPCIPSTKTSLHRSCGRIDTKCRANFGSLSCDQDASILHGSSCATVITSRSFGMMACLLSAFLMIIFIARKFSRSAYDNVIVTMVSYGFSGASGTSFLPSLPLSLSLLLLSVLFLVHSP